MYQINIVNYKDYDLRNEIQINCHITDFNFWKNVMLSKEKRIELIKEGEKYAEDFLLSITNDNS